MSNNRRILISYSAPKQFLSSSTWSQVQTGLHSHLPLRNLHWKSASRSSITTIQELGVSLVQLDTVRDEHTSQVPMTLLERPLLNVYIVSCENTDLEGYKTTVKKQIKEWHSTISSRKNQEWLILHVVRPDSKTPSGNFFQLKGSVIDKIRADFNSDKRERCVQLLLTIDNPAVWGELINKIKDGVLTAFQLAVSQREDEVKRSEGQRQMPGWNFCTFFILKESLARSFEGVKLYDEALTQYGELEDSFHQVLKEKNLSWFGTFITPDPKDDSAPLLSTSKKAYRDLILANTISVFDLRIYLLARQCELLAHSERIVEVCTKVGAFLGAFGRRLREVAATLPPYFVESWTYSSALSVVEQCDMWVSELALDPSISLYNSGKAELLQLARNQLDVIGIRFGHLPIKPPFSSVLTSCDEEASSSGQISNAQLLATFTDREEFYELYIATTTRAIDLYAKAGRRKFALKLHGSIAALDIHRGRLDSALNTYSSLPAHYALHLWTSLEALALRHALDTHSSMEKPQDREWIHILLSFMKTYSSGTELLMTQEDTITYISHLLGQLKTAAAGLEEDLHHPDHPSFTIEIASMAEVAVDKDGSYLEATVVNRLPCTLPVTSVHATLSGADSTKLQFSSGEHQLVSGRSRLKLFSSSPSSGTFVLDSSAIHLQRLLFQWTHRKTSTASSSKRTSQRPVMVKIPPDPLAFRAEVCPPRKVQLDGTPRLLLKVSSGRNKVKKATIKLSSPSINLKLDKTKLISEHVGVTLDPKAEHLTLENIPDHQHIELLLPHTHSTSGKQSISIIGEIEYTTDAEPDTLRSLRTTSSVLISLPISVNVEDFFREKRLFSKFTVTTAEHHVRICDAKLEVDPEVTTGVSVFNRIGKIPMVYTVKKTKPVDFLFQINSSDGPVREPLTLCVKYRLLSEEIEAVITAAVHNAISEEQADRGTVIRSLIEQLQSTKGWMDLYEITGEIDLPEDDGAVQMAESLKEKVQQIKEGLRTRKPFESTVGSWRSVRIPVDVPHKNIVASVGFKISPELLQDSKPIYAGQPIPATITIHTSFHWGSSHNDRDRQYAMQYDVEEMVREWLISGRKRGNFIAKDNGSFTIPITLVALHHGEFALPQVVVSALPLMDEMTMGGSMAIPSTETYQTHGAETILVLPRGGRSTYVLGMS